MGSNLLKSLITGKPGFGHISTVFKGLYFFIPLGDLISSILFMLYFSYLYLFGDVWLNYSIVSYEVI